MKLVKRAAFGAMTVDYNGDGRGNFYMSREQKGRALGYKNPQKAADNRAAVAERPDYTDRSRYDKTGWEK